MIDSASKWDELIFWTKELAKRPEIIESDRRQTARLSAALNRLRQAIATQDSSWITLLETALAPPVFPSDLRKRNRLMNWSTEHQSEAMQAFQILWDDSISVEDRFTGFNLKLGESGAWSNTLETSAIHSVMGDREFPIFRPIANSWLVNAVNNRKSGQLLPNPANIGHEYREFLNFVDEFRHAATTQNLTTNNRCDAYALLMAVLIPRYQSKVAIGLRDRIKAFRTYAVQGTDWKEYEDEDLPSLESSDLLMADKSAIIDAMKEFDLSYRDSPEWGNWPKPHHRWGVKHEDKIYPVKQIFFMATGEPKVVFTTY